MKLKLFCVLSEEEKARRWQEVRIRQNRIQSGDLQGPAHFESSLVDTGFSMSDIKGTSSEKEWDVFPFYLAHLFVH